MSADRVALTPDFYRYGWLPPASLAVNDRFVTFHWSDGAELVAFDLWLRENGVGPGGVDPATRECTVDPAEHSDATRVTSAQICPDGAIELRFAPDGAIVRYHPGWLRHVATGMHCSASWLPAATPWCGSTMAEPPTHQGPAVLADEAARCAWLNDLVKWGIARLRDLPDDPQVARTLAGRVGPIRDTNFGPIWDVKADVTLAGAADTNSTANTNMRLGPHTDLPTRETPPGFQFLHCFVNKTTGGASTMADGLAVVAHLQAHFPDHYEALTTLRWIFFNRGPGIDHRWSGPMIDLGVPGSPLTLRAFYPVRGFPDMAPNDMPRAYAAMRCFSQLAASPQFQMRYGFESGDMVAFDNRRILHGRDSFASGGARHLRGMYIDHDDVLSATRVANRLAAERAGAASATTGASDDPSERKGTAVHG